MASSSGIAKPCPECGANPAAEFKPFCSKACADRDLNRWLTGRYVIQSADMPGDDADDDSAEG
jgi:endogenous inhibitor of DNA gyrase (YacG/DUF329 family)